MNGAIRSSIGPLVCMVFLSVVCPARSQPAPVIPKEATAAAVASNAFGFRLFTKLFTGKDNLFISPFSIAQALCMTYNGAAGTTGTEMAGVLGIDGMTREQVNTGHRSLLQTFQNADPKVETNIANALWLNPGETQFLPDFIARDQDNYGAKIFSTKITGDAGVDAINDWVKEKTQAKIVDLLKHGDLDGNSRLVLTNAVYFKGTWTTVFNKALTREMPFTMADGQVKQVPMMRLKESFAYGETDQAQIIALPYGNQRLRMVLVLPKPDVSLDALAGKLSVDTWTQWTGLLRDQKVALGLPRFTAEYEQELSKPLNALGMVQAFNKAADFSGMNGKRDLCIALVRHKAKLEVNEEGTVAAAATAVVMRLGGAMGHHDPVMIVNHPFLCAIEDTQTSAILFLGAIGNPQTL